MKRSWKIVGIAAALCFIVTAGIAFADTTGAVKLVNPLDPCSDLTCVVKKVIDFLFTLAIPICGIMVVVGGFQMMTAAGNPEKVSTGRKTLLYAAIGFAVILVSGGVATLIQSLFGGS